MNTILFLQLLLICTIKAQDSFIKVPGCTATGAGLSAPSKIPGSGFVLNPSATTIYGIDVFFNQVYANPNASSSPSTAVIYFYLYAAGSEVEGAVFTNTYPASTELPSSSFSFATCLTVQAASSTTFFTWLGVHLQEVVFIKGGHQLIIL